MQFLVVLGGFRVRVAWPALAEQRLLGVRSLSRARAVRGPLHMWEAKQWKRAVLGVLIVWTVLDSSVGFVAEVFFNTQGRLERGPAESEPAESGCFVPVYRGRSLVRPAPSGGMEPVLLPLSAAEGKDTETAWLGRARSGPLLHLQERSLQSLQSGSQSKPGKRPGFWLLDLSASAEPPDPAVLAEGGQWGRLRSRTGPSVIDDLAADDYAALLATAVGLSEWHRSVRFCATCGGRTEH